MNWAWLRFADLGVDNLYDAMALRNRVFAIEQNCVYEDADGVDRRCWHLLGRDREGVLQAYLRVVEPGVKYAEPSLGRVITAPAARRTGLGRVLVAEGLARCDGIYPGRANRIGAQARLAHFYAGFGYTGVGEPYVEDGIPHLEMLRPAR